MQKYFHCLLLFFVACSVGLNQQAVGAGKKKKPLESLPAMVPAPDDNPTTPAKVELGRQLFFDVRLSGNNQMSCASCHLPDKSFADGQPQSQGHAGRKLSRNTPSLLNVAFLPRYFWDGRVTSLEEQALGPIQSPAEMNQGLNELEVELRAIPGYVTQFSEVFDAEITRVQIGQALAAFQRTLVSKPAPFDRFLAGEQDAISAAARRGMELFQGDAGCVRCHRGPLLSDGEFYRLGLAGEDAGLAAITHKSADRGKFRTPPLRNVAQTGPYMHDGSMKSLNDVVTYYYRGVPTIGNDGMKLDVQPLIGQSFSEIPDIVAFLESLSGESPKIEAPHLP